MNQVLKRRVYQRGTTKQALFMSELGGMTEEETKMLLLLHEGRDDQYIQDALGISRNAFDLIEESTRAKLLIAVFECINFTRDNQ